MSHLYVNPKMLILNCKVQNTYAYEYTRVLEKAPYPVLYYPMIPVANQASCCLIIFCNIEIWKYYANAIPVWPYSYSSSPHDST